MFRILAKAGLRDALDTGDDLLAVRAVFQRDREDALLAVLSEGVVIDETLFFEDFAFLIFEAGISTFSWNTEFALRKRVNISAIGSVITMNRYPPFNQ